MRRGLGELDDLEPIDDVEQLVLEVEDGQLAAVAGGELDDADARSARRPPRLADGRRPGRDIHQRPSRSEGRRPARRREHRPVTADEVLAQLAVAAQPDAALHVPLQRHADPARGAPRGRPGSAVAGIIRSGPQMNAAACRAVPGGLVEQVGHDADPPEPLRDRPGRRSSATSMSVAGGQRGELVDVEPVGGRPSPVEDPDVAEAARGRRRMRRSRGRSGASPMPPVTMTTSRPRRLSSGQPLPSGPRRPSVVAGPQARQGAWSPGRRHGS